MRDNCPFAETPRWMYTVLALWARCKTYGALPVAGGIDDQPGFVLMCFDRIEAGMNQAREEQRQRQEREMKARQRAAQSRRW